jgi:putative large structural protein
MNLIRYRKLRKILSATLALILFHESAFVGYRGEWSAQPLTPPNLSAPGYDRQDVQPHFDRANRSRDRYEWDSIMTGARSEVRLAWEQTVDAQIEAERQAILQSDAIHDADDYRSYIVSELEIQKERAFLQWQAALDAEIEAERRAFLIEQDAENQQTVSGDMGLWRGIGSNAAVSSGNWNTELSASAERERQRELRHGQQDAEKQWRRELEQALRKAQWDYQAGYGELEDRYLEIQDQLDAREAEFDNNLQELRQLEQQVRTAIANQVTALRNELSTNSFYHQETCIQSNCTTDANQLSPAGQELADLLTQLETGLANNAPISTLAQTMATTLANQEAYALQRAANWNTQINGSRNYSITQGGGYFTSTSVDICIPGFGCFPQVTLHPQVPQLAQWVLDGDTTALQNYLQGTETRQITAVTGASFSGSSNYWEGTGLFGEWLGDVARGGANNQTFQACQHTLPAPINCATYNDALYYLKYRWPPPGFGVDHTPEFEENLHYTFSYTYHDNAAETNRDRYAAYGAALGTQSASWLNDLLPAITNWETQLAAYEASYGAWLGEAAQIRADADSAFQVGVTELRGAYVTELQRLDNLRVEGEDFWHKANETRRENEKKAETTAGPGRRRFTSGARGKGPGDAGRISPQSPADRGQRCN